MDLALVNKADGWPELALLQLRVLSLGGVERDVPPIPTILFPYFI